MTDSENSSSPQSAAHSASRNGTRRPTQHDVARLAGVSRGTVSYVVNGLADGNVPISPETQARVWAAVEQLGYVPDAGARALRSGSSQTIALVIPDLNNPHFWETAAGVEQEARAAGYRLLFSSMALNEQYGEDIFKDLSGRRIDAVILMGSITDHSKESEKTLDLALKRGLPIIEIHDRERRHPRVDCVISNYSNATREVIAHLLGLGHTRIGLLYGVAQTMLAEDRLIPYRESLQAAGIPVDESLIAYCGPEVEEGYQAARTLLARADRPTAIIAINDLMSIATLRAAADFALRVPDDLSVVGFDDILLSRYMTPRLTTATKDTLELGRAATRVALNRVLEPNQPRQVVHFPTRLIIRDSTAPAPNASATGASNGKFEQTKEALSVSTD